MHANGLIYLYFLVSFNTTIEIHQISAIYYYLKYNFVVNKKKSNNLLKCPKIAYILDFNAVGFQCLAVRFKSLCFKQFRCLNSLFLQLTEAINITLKDFQNGRNGKPLEEPLSITRSNDDLTSKLAEYEFTNLKIGLKIFLNSDNTEYLIESLEKGKIYFIG